MGKYWSFFKMRLMAGLQYRAAALAGMSTQFVWGAMEILLYRAFWLEHPERFPMGMEALSNYIWLQQAFLTLFAMWNWEMEILESVKTGTVSYELLRPTDIYGMWMARSVANRFARAALRMVPVIVVSSLLPAPYGQFTADRGLDVDGVIGHHVLRHDRGELFAVCAAQGARRLREGQGGFRRRPVTARSACTVRSDRVE